MTLGTTGDVADGEDRFVHTVAVNACYLGGSVEPMMSVIVPVDSELRDLFNVNAILTAGLQMPLGF